jgi:FkbM family methyltransferase
MAAPTLVTRLAKPWYVYRPAQAARRLLGLGRGRPRGRRAVRLAFGLTIRVDPANVIGAGIWDAGVFDLAVTELLFRLVDPGDRVVDAGANVGYMTGVLGLRAGPAGLVTAFEPHPQLFQDLAENVALFRSRPGFAPVELVQAALSDRDGEATLVCPESFSENNGLAFLGDGPAGAGRTYAVRARRLDGALAGGPVGLLKLDVEGHELAVLRGAGDLVRGRHVRHVVYEDHRGASSDVGRYLRECGYAVFQVGWELRGPLLGPPDGPRLCRDYEAPAFLATAQPDLAAARCRPRGWRSLRPAG